MCGFGTGETSIPKSAIMRRKIALIAVEGEKQWCYCWDKSILEVI